MIKIGYIKIKILNDLALYQYSESFLNYCDKRLISFNENFYKEIGKLVSIQCSELLQDRGGEFFPNCSCQITGGGRLLHNYILHLVATKDKNHLSRMYFNALETAYKYRIKSISLDLFQYENISKQDSLIALYDAINLYNKNYQKKIIININEEDNTINLGIKQFFNKKNNNFIQKIKSALFF